MKTWIVLTIAEPFPVVGPLDRDKARAPFYTAGSKWYHLPADRDHVERQAAGLRERGWTVTVTEEQR